MVEAGGTEKAFEYFEQGAPRVTEDVIANGLEVAKTWIRESIELQRELVRKAGPKDTIDFVLFVDYGDARLRACCRRRSRSSADCERCSINDQDLSVKGPPLGEPT